MEPGAAELYDQALLGILQHVGNVQDFLRVLFGFLYRKTDFYRLLRHPSDRMGFPPGAAQALVLQVMRGRREARGGGRPWEPRPRPQRARPRSPRLSGSPDPCETAAPFAAGLSSSSGAAPDQPPGAAASADMLLGYQVSVYSFRARGAGSRAAWYDRVHLDIRSSTSTLRARVSSRSV